MNITPFDTRHTPIYVGKDILNTSLRKTLEEKTPVVFIYDRELSSWADVVLKQLSARTDNILLLSVPPGETSKCRAMKAEIEDAMLEKKYGRNTCIVALGGGAVTDLAGFVAATYVRGVSCVYLPTTILGMVDASIGGKTGINTPQGKNLIGSFHTPRAVIVEMSFLSTLPFPLYRDGFAEVIKYGCILNKNLFAFLSDTESYESKHPLFLEKVITESVIAKIDVVLQDPHESGRRRILNFGHTVAHAFEKVSGYSISHGAAVAAGMVAESFISVLKGHLSEKEHTLIVERVRSYGFRKPDLSTASFEDLYSAMCMDKKNTTTVPRFVLLSSIGSVCPFGNKYCQEVDKETIRTALLHMEEVL